MLIAARLRPARFVLEDAPRQRADRLRQHLAAVVDEGGVSAFCTVTATPAATGV